MAKPTREQYMQEVTDMFITEFENGKSPWKRSWDTVLQGPPRRHNGEPYRGLNAITLDIASQRQGRQSPFYMTALQAKKYGGYIRKGEKGQRIHYFEPKIKEVENEQGETEEQRYALLRTYCVFNADQVVGLPEKFHPKPLTPTEVDAYKRQEDPAVMKALIEMNDGLNLAGGYTEKGDAAFYNRATDSITMPPRENFHSFYEYAGTRLHEMGHATETSSRLNLTWPGGQKSFGNKAYAHGEKYAELTSCFASAELGFVNETIENSAAYVRHWVDLLKEDKSAIFKMASVAQAGADYLLDKTTEFNKEKRHERYALEFQEDAKQSAFDKMREATRKGVKPAPSQTKALLKPVPHKAQQRRKEFTR